MDQQLRPIAATPTRFCGAPHAPTPSVSANGVSGGLLWAIESANANNLPGQHSPNCGGSILGSVLHVYDATALSEYYKSSAIQIGGAVNFPVPTIFNGKVYVGTKTVPTSGTNVDVFGLCGSQSGGCIQ